MQRKVINPTTVFNSLQYGFSQAMEVPEGRRIMLSGQVGVDAQEHTVGPGIAEQTAQRWTISKRCWPRSVATCLM